MVKIKTILQKINRKWIKLRLRPIRVFCLHHVCKKFDANSMNPSDWIQTDEFKHKILQLKSAGVKFISLTQAHDKLSHNYLRFTQYAVLTFDDGYASVFEILPWLQQQNIPVTLFLNGKYLDGKSYRKNSSEKYLTTQDLSAIISPLVEIGSHGWEHIDASLMDMQEFASYIATNVDLLRNHPRYIPFHAYTWGRYTQQTDHYLWANHIIPVYVNGMKNYNNTICVHRELI